MLRIGQHDRHLPPRSLESALIAFGVSTWLWLSLLLMLSTGFGMMQGMAASNTIIQTMVDEEKRGRVMSYYTMAFVGMAPFGSLLAGGLAHWVGARRYSDDDRCVLHRRRGMVSRRNCTKSARHIRPIYREWVFFRPRWSGDGGRKRRLSTRRDLFPSTPCSIPRHCGEFVSG